MNTKTLVKAIVNGNAAKVKEVFRSCLNSNIREKIGERKNEIGQRYFVKEETEKDDEDELDEGGEGSGKKGHTTDKTQHGDFKPGSSHSTGEISSKGYKYKGVHGGSHVFQHHRTGHVHHFDQTAPGKFKHKYSVGIRKDKKYQG